MIPKPARSIATVCLLASLVAACSAVTSAPVAAPAAHANLDGGGFIPPAGTILSKMEDLREFTMVDGYVWHWEELRREELHLGRETRWMVFLEQAGNSAAVVFLQQEARGFRILASHEIDQGGNGVTLTLVDRCASAERNETALLFRVERAFRGYYLHAGEGDCVEPDPDREVDGPCNIYPAYTTAFTVLGVDRERAWLIADETKGEDPPALRRVPGVPARCL